MRKRHIQTINMLFLQGPPGLPGIPGESGPEGIGIQGPKVILL